jgi:hypothetical protein
MLCSLFKGEGDTREDVDVLGEGGGRDGDAPMTAGDDIGTAKLEIDSGLVREEERGEG